MAKRSKFTRRTSLSSTYQAICRKGDFIGNVYTDRSLADAEANAHQNEPGKMSHSVDVVGTETSRFTLHGVERE